MRRLGKNEKLIKNSNMDKKYNLLTIEEYTHDDEYKYNNKKHINYENK